jgi:hypothetical protein
VDSDPEVSRRAFLVRASSVSLAGLAGLVGPTSAAEPSTGTSLDLRGADRDTFAPHVGSSFRVTGAATDTINLQLAAVRDLRPTGRPGACRSPFALVFRAAGHDPLPQNTYQLRHAEIGHFPLFLVPGSPGPSGTVYVAVFT